MVIVHGNGPQVGWINNSFTNAFKSNVSPELLPFPECGAMSQGYIGFHIQNAIYNELTSRNHPGTCITLVSQTLVDKNDIAFSDPTKPIGEFMDEKIAKEMATKNNWVVKEDSGRGWRRVIASPKPKDLFSIPIIKSLLESRTIVIVGGGGGIPVIQDNNELIGVDAVIDKDLTASLIAQKLNAEKLLILTSIDAIKINFNKPNEVSLKSVSISEIDDYVNDGQFAKGSMLPKVLAVRNFTSNTHKPSFIGHLDDASQIINMKSGTLIKN